AGQPSGSAFRLSSLVHVSSCNASLFRSCWELPSLLRKGRLSAEFTTESW
ncbi:hypothetical protein CEXT_294281, partial [Caerostris extrusa]